MKAENNTTGTIYYMLTDKYIIRPRYFLDISLMFLEGTLSM